VDGRADDVIITQRKNCPAEQVEKPMIAKKGKIKEKRDDEALCFKMDVARIGRDSFSENRGESQFEKKTQHSLYTFYVLKAQKLFG
jgi:hypothetical protein